MSCCNTSVLFQTFFGHNDDIMMNFISSNDTVYFRRVGLVWETSVTQHFNLCLDLKHCQCQEEIYLEAENKLIADGRRGGGRGPQARLLGVFEKHM